jgi:hypothetical protein
VWVSLSTGSSFPAPTRWIQAFDLAHGWTVSGFVRTVGDVSGDGKADLVGFGLDGVYVAKYIPNPDGLVSREENLLGALLNEWWPGQPWQI